MAMIGGTPSSVDTLVGNTFKPKIFAGSYFLQPFIALFPCFTLKAAKLHQLPFEIDFVLVGSGRSEVDENMCSLLEIKYLGFP